MLDKDLESSVNDELLWDPKVDPAAIAVSAREGVVTLRGTVGSFREKREARKATERVYGVTSVDNQLQVRILDENRLEDADLRGAVLQALMLDSLIPNSVDAKVKDGVVTLTGAAEWQYQRDEAELVAANMLGVVDVKDHIELLYPTPSAGDVRDDIKGAFKRNAKIDADDLSVETSNGTVTLSGVVSSWSEHDEAVAAAWSAPGVVEVDDNLLVEY